MPTQRYKLTVAYRGTRYHGWQAQPALESFKGELAPDRQGIPTVQGILARTIASVVGHPVNLVGSSRTDARVHAKGQVAHFDTDQTQIPIEGLRQAVNARLPEDILIRAIEPAPDSFDAITSTVRKRYQYFIWNQPDRPVFFADLAWHRWHPLAIEPMQQAAQAFEGEHDFTSFARPGHGRNHAIRSIYRCRISARGPQMIFSVEGSGFLWNMVRIMVGTLVEIGMGKHSPDVIAEMLAARDRQASGPTAPAHGLYLHWIQFQKSLNNVVLPTQPE